MRIGRMFPLAEIIVASVIAISVSEAHAVNSCTATCNSNCALTTNVDCSNQDGIILSGGADFDLAGYTISCSTNCPQAAVKIAAGNSVVSNGTISGIFTYGVNCQSQSNSQVTALTVTGVTNGIYNCAKTSNNLVVGSLAGGSTGIAAANLANSDYVRDNWVEGFAIAIGGARTHDIDVERNSIGVEEITAGGGANKIGINMSVSSGSPTVTVQYNFFFGAATLADFMTNQTGVSYVGNMCDPDNALCANCTNCRQPVAPVY